MYRATPPIGRPRGRKPLPWLALGLIVAATGLSAATRDDVPDGLPGGKLVFQPWLVNEVLADDNLFRRPDNDPNNPPESDVESSYAVGVTAFLPFRSSDLQLGYEGTAAFYRNNTVDNVDSHIGSVELNLKASNRDEFTIRGRYENGITQRLTAEIDETTFEREEIIEGIPLVRSNWSVEWNRRVPQRPNWRARLDWVDQRYEPDDVDSAWVDYQGWTGRAEYGQPIYRRGFLTATYDGRRQDQFQTRSLTAADDRLRSEVYDALQVGFRGLVGRKQPIWLSVGYGKLDFEDLKTVDPVAGPPRGYRGVVGNATWRLPVGEVSNLSVALNRRPSASLTYNTYYLVNEMRVRLDRRALRNSRFGASTLFSRNRYGAPLIDPLLDTVSVASCGAGGEENIVRKDRRQQLEGFWEWFIQPRMAMRLTAGHNRRKTNCPTEAGSYVSNSIGVTLKLGWFD